MAYIGNSPGVASQRIVTTFTATSNQTTFTPQSGYTVGYIDVYHNGVRLVNGDDYTASNGTTVVLASGAAADDVVETVAYLPRGLSDGYTKTEADARYLQLGGGTLTGTLNATALNTSGAVVFNDAGADVDFRVEGDTNPNLLFVDASADAVGIGTSTPSSLVTVSTSADDQDGVYFQRATAAHTFGIRGDNAGTLEWRAGGSYGGGGITMVGGLASSNPGIISFHSGTTSGGLQAERMRVTSAGAVEIANGNLKFTTNGTGIDFSASAGGGASSSLLNDYEQGTWTPTLSTGTPTSQAGVYIKIGSFVWLKGRVSYTITDTSSEYLRLGGLPFAIPSDTDNRGYQIMYASTSGTHAWETYDGTGNLALSQNGNTFFGNRSVFSGVSFQFNYFYPTEFL